MNPDIATRLVNEAFPINRSPAVPKVIQKFPLSEAFEDTQNYWAKNVDELKIEDFDVSGFFRHFSGDSLVNAVGLFLKVSLRKRELDIISFQEFFWESYDAGSNPVSASKDETESFTSSLSDTQRQALLGYAELVVANVPNYRVFYDIDWVRADLA